MLSEAVRMRLLLAASAIAMVASCYSPHPRFGAEDFSRLDKDVDGVPAYLAAGQLGPNESADRKAAQTVNAACPRGNPRIIKVQSFEKSTEDSYGRDETSTSWVVQFTCRDVISTDGEN